MARIRTIKPEFWTDERVGECSVSARLLFIASFNFADDQGGLERSAKQLKAQAFPYDAIDCEPLVLELIRVGLLIEYEVADRKYLHIKGFRKHQKVEKPAKPRIPVYEQSMQSSSTLTEDSPSPPRLLTEELRSLREGNGRDLDLHTARATAPREAETEIHEQIMAIKARYPKATREDWITGEKNARNLVLNGAATWPELIAGVDRYAKLCKATGRMVLNPANFFGAIDRPWSQAWDIPTGKPDARPQRNDEAAWAEQKSRAAALGFRTPWPQESVGAYKTEIDVFERTPVSRRVSERIGEVAAALRVGT